MAEHTIQALGGAPAGWFSDPWGQAPHRWWDGSGWTAHVSAHPVLSIATNPPDVEVAKAAGTARWLSLAVLARPLLALLGAWLFARVASQFFDDIRAVDPAAPFDPTMFQSNNNLAALQLVGLFQAVPTVLYMLWTYRITAAARALGRSTRQTPGFACVTWIIPVLSFWMPYQTIQDAFPHGMPPRAFLGWWWAAHLIGPLVLGAAGFASGLVGGGLSWGILGVGSALGLGFALLDRRTIRLVTQTQADALRPAG